MCLNIMHTYLAQRQAFCRHLGLWQRALCTQLCATVSHRHKVTFLYSDAVSALHDALVLSGDLAAVPELAALAASIAQSARVAEVPGSKCSRSDIQRQRSLMQSNLEGWACHHSDHP